MPVTVRPTRTDKEIARIIARNTTPTMEETAEILTWGADEHVLCAAAAVWWLYCRGRPAPERAASNHILITTIAATILPHLMKHVFTQERPDRRSVRAHLHGTPFSGSPLQAFPSGHAVHVGALASAAAELPSPQRMLAWMAGGGPASSCWRTGRAMSRRDLRSVPRLNASSDCSRATAVVEVRDRWDRRFHHPDRTRFTCAWTCKIFSRLGDRGRRRGWKRRYPPSRGLPHIPPNEPCSPVSFRPQAPRALAACGANYKRWDNVTRDPLALMFWSLCPELRDFVPPAGVIDRLGCGQQDSLPPSVRPSDGQRPFFAHLGANAQHSFHKRCSRKAVQAEGSS